MKPNVSTEGRKRLGRVPLLALGMVSLVTGVWGGLVRLPLGLPIPSHNANWLTFHGPLMVCGFLGTVIGLERAVGLQMMWTYAAPLVTGAGAVALVAGAMGPMPLILITAGSALFATVAMRVVQMQRSLFTTVMCAGAMAWVTGNALWWHGWTVNRVVPWWMAFLALTIVGERIDLSRFQKPSPWSQPLLWAALGLFLGGVIATALHQVAGERLTGMGLLALALWLGRFDIARRTVRQTGLTRFMAVCLLIGYVWLAVSGVLMTVFSPLESGLRYDAVLHTFFLGFVFSMIIGHAPVIFPAVLLLRPTFRTAFYAHLAVLHAGLVLRVGADLADWPHGRQWCGAINAMALALFVANTVGAFVWPAKAAPPARAG
jgi:hypothetical protein